MRGRPLPRPRSTARLGLGLAVALLAGCSRSSAGVGSSSDTAQQIVTASKAAADGAATVHVSGTVHGAGGPLSIDLYLVGGEGGEGRIAQGGHRLRLIHVGRFVYIKGYPALYRRLGAPLAKDLRGGWLKGRTNGALAPFASLTNLDFVVDTAVTSHGTLARKGTSTVDGRKVVAVGDLAVGGTLYVAAQGTPYPLEARTPDGGTITFDRWNQPVTLAAPTDAVNVNQLVGR
jgi:hypothetical protein